MRQFVVLISGAALLVGCGVQDENARLADATRAINSGSTRFEMTMPFAPVGLDDVKILGAIDYDRDRGAEFGSPELDFVGWQSEQRFIGEVAYTGWAPADGDCWRWLETKDYEPSNPIELLFSLHGSARPDRLVKLLRASSRNIENLGTDSVRGVPTQHQRFHFDEARATEWNDYGVVDAWVDDGGLVRRLRFAYSQEDPSPISIDFIDIGAKVDIEPPPAEDRISGVELDAWMDPQASDDMASVVCSRAPGSGRGGAT